MTTRQHYLSRCVIKNFQENESGTFFEYDCLTETMQARNINKLFAGYRYWSKNIETVLSEKYENDLALVLRKYASCPIEYSYTIGKDSIICPQFNGFQIHDENERKILSKLLLQQVLVQQMNASPEEKTPEDFLESVFSYDGLELQYPVIFEIAQGFQMPPLILVDGIVFIFIAPCVEKDKLGHACFMCPISSKRFIIWGTEEDCNFFAYKYRNIDYLNLCMIEQQSKECRIASQNKEYIIWLSKRIANFNSQEKVKVTSCRKSP